MNVGDEKSVKPGEQTLSRRAYGKRFASGAAFAAAPAEMISKPKRSTGREEFVEIEVNGKKLTLGYLLDACLKQAALLSNCFHAKQLKGGPVDNAIDAVFSIHRTINDHPSKVRERPWVRATLEYAHGFAVLFEAAASNDDSSLAAVAKRLTHELGSVDELSPIERFRLWSLIGLIQLRMGGKPSAQSSFVSALAEALPIGEKFVIARAFFDSEPPAELHKRIHAQLLAENGNPPFDVRTRELLSRKQQPTTG